MKNIDDVEWFLLPKESRENDHSQRPRDSIESFVLIFSLQKGGRGVRCHDDVNTSGGGGNNNYNNNNNSGKNDNNNVNRRGSIGRGRRISASASRIEKDEGGGGGGEGEGGGGGGGGGRRRKRLAPNSTRRRWPRRRPISVSAATVRRGTATKWRPRASSHLAQPLERHSALAVALGLQNPTPARWLVHRWPIRSRLESGETP